MIVAGLGFRTSCTAQELVGLVRHAEQAHGVVAKALAAPDFKSGAPQLAQAAQTLGLEVIAISPADLAAAQPHCLTRSPVALAVLGVAAVSEACALAAIGEGAVLLAPKLTSPAATCALARGALS